MKKEMKNSSSSLGKREDESEGQQKENEKMQSVAPAGRGKCYKEPLAPSEMKNYGLVKHIGAGTFGVVSKMLDNRTKKHVATKRVKLGPDGTNRELQMLLELKHPNCISVKSSYYSEDTNQAGEVSKHLNIVMDYIPDNLFTIIQHYYKAKANFPETLAMVYSFQLYRCLHYLQTKRIIHRDIKPQNLLVDTKSQQVYFCDFGSAKKLLQKEGNQTYICSRYYRAPELLAGNQMYDFSADMWSVGCVHAEIYFGIPVFIGTSTKDQCDKICEVLGPPDAKELKSIGERFEYDPKIVKGISMKKKLLGKASPSAIDLIAKVLQIDPEKRLKPIDALMHPYFDPIREKKIIINKHEITDLFNFTQDEKEGYERLITKITPSWYNKKQSN